MTSAGDEHGQIFGGWGTKVGKERMVCEDATVASALFGEDRLGTAASLTLAGARVA